MRVTGVIKDYITREVNKKYQEKLDSIPNDYQEDYDKMIDEIDKIIEECDKNVKEIANKYNMLNDDNHSIVNYSTYYLGNNERRQKRQKLERELKQQRDDKVAEIILSLELGETTKKELTDLLKNVEF